MKIDRNPRLLALQKRVQKLRDDLDTIKGGPGSGRKGGGQSKREKENADMRAKFGLPSRDEAGRAMYGSAYRSGMTTQQAQQAAARGKK